MSFDVLESKKDARGWTLEIVPDFNPENPRDWCNLGKFITETTDNKYLPQEETLYIDWEDREKAEKQLAADKTIAAYLPVYVYDHSGVAYNTRGFSCPWDSGQVGWIVAFWEDVKKAYPTWKKLSKKRRNIIEALLASEVEIFGKYANGAVYGYALYDDESNLQDSCYGYYDVKEIYDMFPEFKEA